MQNYISKSKCESKYSSEYRLECNRTDRFLQKADDTDSIKLLLLTKPIQLGCLYDARHGVFVSDLRIDKNLIDEHSNLQQYDDIQVNRFLNKLFEVNAILHHTSIW